MEDGVLQRPVEEPEKRRQAVPLNPAERQRASSSVEKGEEKVLLFFHKKKNLPAACLRLSGLSTERNIVH
jgi:hypothetical protein